MSHKFNKPLISGGPNGAWLQLFGHTVTDAFSRSLIAVAVRLSKAVVNVSGVSPKCTARTDQWFMALLTLNFSGMCSRKHTAGKLLQAQGQLRPRVRTTRPWEQCRYRRPQPKQVILYLSFCLSFSIHFLPTTSLPSAALNFIKPFSLSC